MTTPFDAVIEKKLDYIIGNMTELSSRVLSHSAVLSDADITKELEIKNGSVVISPFNADQLNNSSYDVTLGEHYYSEEADERLPSRYDVLCPWVSKTVEAYWGKLKTADILDAKGAKECGLSIGTKVIMIPPGRTILAHTQEFIGGRGDVTTMMKARSSMGRCCISVCKCAGMGDIGYVNRWTLEIQNTGLWYLALPVGARVAQIVFFRSSQPLVSYEAKGAYQKASPYDLNRIKAEWKPENMLPKLKPWAVPIVIGDPLQNPPIKK